MPNIAKVLKEEIRRISRSEIKAETASLRKDNARLKRDVAALKRETTKLQKNIELLRSEFSRTAETVIPDQEELRKMRITGKMIKKLRDRLKLTQTEFGQLMGVSGQSVYQWEHKDGAIRLRDTTRVALQRVRQLSPAQAREELDAVE